MKIHFLDKGVIIISVNKDLPITKKQFEKSIPDFIKKYNRLPFLKEDDVEINMKNDKGKMELKPYRANRYIEEFYGNQDKMTKELFDKNIITYKLIADITELTETIVKNIITKETKNPDIQARHKIDMFFNNDFYEKELGKYNDRCMDCKKKCKQHYYSTIVVCPNYKEKKKKK